MFLSSRRKGHREFIRRSKQDSRQINSDKSARVRQYASFQRGVDATNPSRRRRVEDALVDAN